MSKIFSLKNSHDVIGPLKLSVWSRDIINKLKTKKYILLGKKRTVFNKTKAGLSIPEFNKYSLHEFQGFSKNK